MRKWDSDEAEYKAIGKRFIKSDSSNGSRTAAYVLA